MSELNIDILWQEDRKISGQLTLHYRGGAEPFPYHHLSAERTG